MQKKESLTVAEAQKKMEYFCSYQERCHKEVMTKLMELDMIPEAKDIIITRLIEHNYLNETRFAKSFARGKFRIKKWGKNRILRELKMRQISEYNIIKGIKEISANEYENTFFELFEKKRKHFAHLPKLKQKKKIFSYLYYRGWESQKIYEALKQI